MSQLVDPFNVNFRAKGIESNGQWTTPVSGTTAIQSPLIQNWSSVAVSSDGRFVIACVNGGQVFTSSNYGYNMVPDTTLPSSAAWSGVTISCETDITIIKATACINGGGIYVATLNGSTWSWIPQQNSFPAAWSSITPSIETDSDGIISSLFVAACINNDTDTGPYGIYVSLVNFPTYYNSTPAKWSCISYLRNAATLVSFIACINNDTDTGLYGIYVGTFSILTQNTSPVIWTVINNSKAQWTCVSTNFNYNLDTPSQYIFACVSGGGIYIGTYNSTTWSWTQSNAPNLAWSSVACNSTGQYVVACVNGGGIYCSIDYGMNWQEQINGLNLLTSGSPSWSCVASDSTGTFLVGAINGGNIYISPYFQGIQWNSSLGNNNSWYSVDSDGSGKNLIACARNGIFGSSGGLYISNNYGITWTATYDDSFTSTDWNCVASNSDGSILGAVIYIGGVYISLDKGATWSLQKLGDTANCNQIAFNSSGTTAVVCSYYTNYDGNQPGGIYVGTYNNSTWTWFRQGSIYLPSVNISWTSITISSYDDGTNADGANIYACGTSNTTENNGIWRGVLGPDGYSWSHSFNPEYNIYFYDISCSDSGQYVIACNTYATTNAKSLYYSSNYCSQEQGFSYFIQSTAFPTGMPIPEYMYGFRGATMDSTGQKMAVTFYNGTPNYNITNVYQTDVYVSTNGGNTWLSQSETFSTYKSNLLPVGNSLWRSISCNDNMDRLVVCAFASTDAKNNKVYSSGIFTSFISQTSWTPQLNALPTKNVFSKVTSSSDGKYLAVVAENTTTLGNNYGGIWISSDSGKTWIKSTAENFCWNAIASDNTGQYLVAGVFGGKLYTSSNYGYSWTIQSSTATANWCAITFSCNSDNSDSTVVNGYVYAQANEGKVYYSKDRGTTWVVALADGAWSNGMASSSDGYYAYSCVLNNTPATTAPYGIYITYMTSPITPVWVYPALGLWNYIATDNTGQYVVAVNKSPGDYGNSSYGIYFSSDFGVNWNQIVQQAQIWNAITLVNTESTLLVNAICENGLIYSGTCIISSITTSPTGTWTWTFNSATTDGGTLPATIWNDIHASSDGRHLVLCSTTGGIWTSADFGVNWSQSTLANTYYKTAITSSSTGQNLAAIINNGPIYTSSDYGSNWSSLISSSLPSYNLYNSYNWYSITSSITGQYIVASTTVGEIYVSSNYGQSWTKTIIGANPVVSISSSGQYIVAASNLGSIYFSSNFGSSWAQLTEEENDLPSVSVAWSAIAMSSSGQYMVAAINGGTIYISSNFGSTWSPVSTTPSNWSSIAISDSGQNIVAAINGGAIYISSDYGSTWPSVTEEANWTSVAISGTGQYIVATIDGGTVYSSANYGSQWSQIYPIPTTPPTPPTYDLTAITTSTSGQYLAAITPNGAICIYSNFMDIGNILGSLINELQIQLQNNQTQLQLQNLTPTGSIMAFGGTTDPIGWVIMNGAPRNNNGQYNNLLLMGIGTLNSDNTYSPPNYSGAFLRGTGTTIEGYSGPDINTSQSMGIMQHNHSIYDPGHTHTDNGHIHQLIVTRTYDADVSTDQTAVGNMWTDHQTISPVNTYKGFADITANYTNVAVTTNSVTSTAGYNVNETRPYNFGVNWIVKL